jgi:hypothetical protein
MAWQTILSFFDAKLQKKANLFQDWLSNYAAARTCAGAKFTFMVLPVMALKSPSVSFSLSIPVGPLLFCRSYRSSERPHGEVCLWSKSKTNAVAYMDAILLMPMKYHFTLLWSRRDSNPRADK